MMLMCAVYASGLYVNTALAASDGHVMPTSENIAHIGYHHASMAVVSSSTSGQDAQPARWSR